ncbi:hypothetical protein IE53DRAFT_70322 [Violaceomyces palustris]|uniref:Uncharacterized protein n=1 Tax=Violaceomyces palustris TaxID=1673888 RepID=A0ACD0P8R4_9BASI|nr:hypothetical protein IE53DRAFT_70322 [Violaceomyces palustris]
MNCGLWLLLYGHLFSSHSTSSSFPFASGRESYLSLSLSLSLSHTHTHTRTRTRTDGDGESQRKLRVKGDRERERERQERKEKEWGIRVGRIDNRQAKRQPPARVTKSNQGPSPTRTYRSLARFTACQTIAPDLPCRPLSMACESSRSIPQGQIKSFKGRN